MAKTKNMLTFLDTKQEKKKMTSEYLLWTRRTLTYPHTKAKTK